MNETVKPFACSTKGCEMTFTNEDHLNWHQKKHDMMLNLGSSNKNCDADQTPTPTRFIRNCDEVGLFQDLNVNPFDDIFKKAAESAKNGILHVPEPSTDDTLHTPHVFPSTEINQVKYTNIHHEESSNDFLINTEISVPQTKCTEEHFTESEETKRIIKEVAACDTKLKDSLDNSLKQQDEIKNKLKESIKNKEKSKIDKILLARKLHISPSLTISVIDKPFKLIPQNINQNNVNNKIIVDENREKIREMNRAAQLRCRRKKQIKYHKMEEEVVFLTKQNKKLCAENLGLKTELAKLKTILLEVTKKKLIETSVTAEASSQEKDIASDIIDIQTSQTNIVSNCDSYNNPLIVQINPVGNLAVPILSTQHNSGEVILPTIHTLVPVSTNVPNFMLQCPKGKLLKKIVPKMELTNN